MLEERATYFVVIGFRPQIGRRDGLVADPPAEAPDAETALKRARRYGDIGGAAVAFSRTGLPSLGYWEPADILLEIGDVPGETSELIGCAA